MSLNALPILIRARRVIGSKLVFRDINVQDAAFILELRTDTRRSTYISNTSSKLSDQNEWIERYLKRKNEAYFIIENLSAESVGCVRLYDPVEDSFCWGSWILKPGVGQNCAIESALIIYAYAIDHLSFKRSHFRVHKGNLSVWKFHERFGAKRVGETSCDYLYEIELEQILSARQRYKKYLSGPVVVEDYT